MSVHLTQEDVIAFVKGLHNGYSQEAREAMPGLNEPISIIAAIQELIDEAEKMGILEGQLLAEARNSGVK